MDSPSLADVVKQARGLLDALEVDGVSSVPAERHTHLTLAMGAVARSSALLRSVVVLAEAGQLDTIGVQVRALLETWYFGVICLFGDQDDLERFAADYRYWRNDLAEKIGQESIPGAAAKFSVWKRAKRADELLPRDEGQDGPVTTARESYEQLFAGESLMGVHAGLQAVEPFVEEQVDGTIRVILHPDLDYVPAYGLVRMAAVLTGLLAKWTYDRGGIDPSAIEAIDGLWDD